MADMAHTAVRDRVEKRSRPFARVAQRLVVRRLSHITTGCLQLRCPDGSELRFGTADSGPHARLVVHDASFFVGILTGGEIAAGEAYVRQAWDSPDLVQLTRLLMANESVLEAPSPLTALSALVERIRHVLRRNSVTNARHNIAAHYDLSNQLFATFLDRTMTYSSAVFASADDSLEQAQEEKYRRLAELAGVRPEHHVLEIGCGWGGFAEFAASTIGCRVTAITLSEEQATHARQRIARAGLADRVEIRIQDYRHVEGQFDAVVSIEMLEAVGHQYLPTFFATIDRLLAAAGRAAVQVITFPEQGYTRYRTGSDWIRKYIFPGGHLPSLHAMVEATGRHTGLGIRTVHDIGRHYAETLRRWRKAFHANLEQVRALGFDERFVRMWELYLATCEGLFASGKLATLQLELARPGTSRLAQGPYRAGGVR